MGVDIAGTYVQDFLVVGSCIPIALLCCADIAKNEEGFNLARIQFQRFLVIRNRVFSISLCRQQEPCKLFQVSDIFKSRAHCLFIMGPCSDKVPHAFINLSQVAMGLSIAGPIFDPLVEELQCFVPLFFQGKEPGLGADGVRLHRVGGNSFVSLSSSHFRKKVLFGLLGGGNLCG